MKIKENFIFRSVAGENIIVPVGEAALQVKGLIGLNESGKFLFQLLQKGCPKHELLEKFRQEYEVDEGTDLEADVDEFLDDLRALDMLTEDG